MRSGPSNGWTIPRRATPPILMVPIMTSRPHAASRNSDRSLRAILIDLQRRKRWSEVSASMTTRELENLRECWSVRGRYWQVFPGLLNGPNPWRSRPTWLLMGGRGSGKTRAGAEWVRALVRRDPDAASERISRLALIGETFAAARDVMVEGPAGLLASYAHRSERPVWSPSLRRLEWPNGAVAHVFSAEDPDSLRGPQFEAAWADE